jgi:Na+/proline symporter
VWWSAYYPGAEPGGGGYIAQRMLAARSERHAMGAAVLFNLAHYALRPWPWVLVALASLVVFPATSDLAAALPAEHRGLATDDIAYPLMLTKLPPGLLGLVVASIAAAYMSTISTQLNVGSAYLTHDFYRRFLRPGASERHLVWAGRAITFGIVVLAALASFVLESAGNAFRLLILVGAGSGLIYMLRWLWWRVNAAAEIAAMAVSFATASFFVLAYPKLVPGDQAMAGHWQTTVTVAVTTAAWLAATWLFPPTSRDRLAEFARRIRPPGPGWKPFAAEIGPARPGDGAPLGLSLTASGLGVVAVLGALLGTGLWIYGRTGPAAATTLAAAAAAAVLVSVRKRL